VVAFALALASRRDAVAAQLAGADPAPLALSAVAGLAGVGVSGLVWRRALAGLGAVLPLPAAVRVFFVAQLGKYLPGSLWPVLAQAELGRDHGVARRTAVAGQAVFMWVHLLTGGIVGVPVLAAAGVLPAWAALAPLPLLPLLAPRPLAAAAGWALRRTRREPLPAVPGTADMLVACGWALLMWLLYGLHVHWALVAVDAGARGPADVALAVGAFAAAWSAGFLVLVAPAGAGAREAVLVAGLAAATSTTAALTAALLSRLLLTLADAGWGGAGLLAGVRRRPAP
jgi:glycosyltransferase 2 family protein